MEKKPLNNQLKDSLVLFDSISLSEMDSVSLMDRTDTKFVFDISILPFILEKCSVFYKVLEINEIRFTDYKTDYFDTLNFNLYTQHQNSKLNRFKIRYREYIGSNLSFLEVKFKSNKGKTFKSRTKAWFDENITNEEHDVFIKKKTPFCKQELKHVLTNTFSRITLVSKTDKERLTIDFALGFNKNGNKVDLDNLVIAEVKQEKVNRSSKVIQILKDFEIRDANFSKYCIGAALLNPQLKYNSFKHNLLFLNKIHHDRIIWDVTN